MIAYIIIVVLLLMSAFFSGTEIAFTSVNKLRLEKLAEGGSPSAMRAKKLSDNFIKVLGTILIGNNVVNIATSSISTMIAVDILGEGNEGMAATLVTAIVTVVILIFGEITPKMIGKRFSLAITQLISLPLRIITIILTPISVPVNGFVNAISRLFDKNGEEEQLPTVTEEELSSIIETVEEEGIIDEDKSDLLQSALDFSDISIGEILTPRIDMVAIDIDDDFDTIKEVLLNSRYSRLPIYEGSVDHIIGIVYVNRLLKRIANKEEIDIRSLMFEPSFFHKTMKLPTVLSEMRKQHIHMAIVLDEYGGTMGVVTMEDILEEIVGDIWDESDEIKTDFVKSGENSYDVLGAANVHDFFDFIDFDYRDFVSEYTTVGGWTVEMLESIPQEGDSFTYKNLYVIVTEITDKIVSRVSVIVTPEEAED